MVAAGDAELGFGDIATTPDTASLHFNALWRADVVVVSPIGSDLPPVVPRARLAELSLVLPPGGSERREMIDDIVTDAGGHRPSAVLATDERSAWISSAQQGLASFLSYKAVGVEIDHVETRPLDPAVHTIVGFVHRAEGLSADGNVIEKNNLSVHILFALVQERFPEHNLIAAESTSQILLTPHDPVVHTIWLADRAADSRLTETRSCAKQHNATPRPDAIHSSSISCSKNIAAEAHRSAAQGSARALDSAHIAGDLRLREIVTSGRRAVGGCEVRASTWPSS